MTLPTDLIYNLRLLRKNLGFVAICVLMIGLGMGVSITMYSVADNIGTKFFPFDNGDRFVDVYAIDQSPEAVQQVVRDGYIYQTLLASTQSYEVLGAIVDEPAVFSDGEVSERFEAVNITPELMQATGMIPILGRNLQPDDEDPAAEPVAVISFRLWQSYYAGREDIVGYISRINGRSYTIAGVMPEGFTFPEWHDVWLPLQLPASMEPRERTAIGIMGVLEEGVSVQSARIEADQIISQLAADLPAYYGDLEGRVTNCCRFVGFGEDRRPIDILLPALMFSLLLLVCLNVANLILVRTNQRIHEFSIRSALGASRWRLILTVLQDSLLICLMGSLLGIVLADLGMSYVNAAATEALSFIGGLPYTFRFGWELSTIVIALFIVFLIWILSAGLAVWQIARQDLSLILAGGKSAATGSRSALGTVTLVSIEVIFSCFLLILTGVFIGASIESVKTDYGTATQGYLTGQIELASDDYADPVAQQNYRENLRLELLAQNGIEAVSFTTALPSQGGRTFRYQLEDRDLRTNNQYPVQGIVNVAGDYFETMEVSLRAGRTFDGSDTASSLPVVIIDELFAMQLWSTEPDPVQAALGKQIQVNRGSDPANWITLTVVGVVPHIIQGVAMDSINRTSFYRPLAQRCCESAGQPMVQTVVLKVAGAPESYRESLQQAASRVDRNVPVTSIYTVEQWLDTANSVMVFITEIATTMALFTLVLAVTGIFAIVSRAVRQRTKEIGIRRAVGSSDWNVLWVFIRQGLKILCLGLLVGGGGAILAANALNSDSIQLLGWLPLVLVSVVLGLGLLVFFATYNPARSLVAMEPGEALRDE